MITERTLKRWRREALKDLAYVNQYPPITLPEEKETVQKRKETAQRILRMTQELLDQHLLRK